MVGGHRARGGATRVSDDDNRAAYRAELIEQRLTRAREKADEVERLVTEHVRVMYDAMMAVRDVQETLWQLEMMRPQ
jgi:N-glycosylase/DNA lyase